MAVISLEKLNERLEVKPLPAAVAKRPRVAVEANIDLARERQALAQMSAVRGKGYGMYLEGASPEEIAKAVKVPVDTIIIWARDGDWAARLKRVNDARETLVRENLRKRRLERVEEEAEDSAKLGRRIREVVQKRLENPDSLRSMDIKNLADAGKASADTRALDSGSSPAAQESAEKEGRRPLVIVFQDGLPPKRVQQAEEAEVIDV